MVQGEREFGVADHPQIGPHAGGEPDAALRFPPPHHFDDPGQRELYQVTGQKLLSGYKQIHEKMIDYLRGLLPRPEEMDEAAYSRNIAAAQALLTQAGFSTTNKLRFTLWYTPVRYGSTEADVATLVKQALEQTGMVSVTLQSQEWLVYRQSFRLGQFSVFLLGWFPDYLDPDDYTYPFLHYASGGSASFGSWYQNDSVDTLINLQATQPIASTQRAQTLSQIQDALANDVPYLPLWQTSQQVVYKPSISGVILDQSQFFRYFTLRVS